MKCETKLVKLSEVAEIQTGPFGSQLHKEDYVSEGTPIVTVEHLGQRNFTEQNLSYVSDTDKKRLGKYVLRTGDIVFSRVGAVDRSSYVSSRYEGWMFSGSCLRIRSCNLLNPMYLYYLFQLEETKQFVRNIATGSTRPSLNTKFMGEVPVKLFPMETQEKISNILRSVDDKIEINNKINQNLQQQAFLAFDELFQKAGNLSATVTDYAFLNPKRSLQRGEIARCIDMSQLSTVGAFPSGWEMKQFNGGMRFSNGDTLLARITPCLENGKTAFINFLEEDEVAFGSTEYIILSPKPETPPELLYCLARYKRFVDYAVKNMNGSSGRQRVSATIIEQFNLPRFSNKNLQDFHELASPIFKKIQSNSIENMRLSEIRDTLLPNLLSGKSVLSSIEV